MKKNIIRIPFVCVFILMVIVSCQTNKDEYIEITTGFSMNPNEHRIGIMINSKDSMYVCKEIVNNKSQSTLYKYYERKEKIDFNHYKKEIQSLFSDTIIFNLAEDSQLEKLEFSIGGKHYKRFFIASELTDKQNKFVYQLKELINKNNFKEIPYHQFSRDLLDARTLDPPPPLVR